MFRGSIVALVTPFDSTGRIDFVALEKLVTFHLEAGTHGLVIAGSTGESAALEPDEYQALLRAVVSQVAGQVPVIAGTGAAATAKTIATTRTAANCGAVAALVVTPYYVRPTQVGLAAHFQAVADSSEIPIILYNVPSRTGVDLAPGTVAGLSSHDEIVAIKEAVPSMDRIDSLLEQCVPGFTVLSGDDPTCLDAIRHGAVGVISVAANVAAAKMSELCEAALDGDFDQALIVEKKLRPLFEQLAVETNPIPVKWALSAMSLSLPDLRLPLTPLSAQFREDVRRCLAELGLLDE